MFRIDAVMAIDANYQPQQRDTHDSLYDTNQNANSNMSFEDYLDSHLRATEASSQVRATKSHAASFLAWYIPPVMISPKVEEKPKSSSE